MTSARTGRGVSELEVATLLALHSDGLLVALGDDGFRVALPDVPQLSSFRTVEVPQTEQRWLTWCLVPTR